MTHQIHGYHLLPDGAPDMFHGDDAARARHGALSEIDFLETNIATEGLATERARARQDSGRVQIGLGWIQAARRRQAQLRRQLGQPITVSVDRSCP